MSYSKGQILTYHFPERVVKKQKKSNVITEFHRVVVLHKRETPYKTVLIAPITKATSLTTKGSIPSNYVQLFKTDYPFVLDENSYINLDMIMPVDRIEIEKLDRYGKNIDVVLNSTDLYQLDYKLTLTYELSQYFGLELQKEIQQEIANIVEFIDIDIRQRLKEIISKIPDKKLIEEIIEIIDLLAKSIKLNYMKK